MPATICTFWIGEECVLALPETDHVPRVGDRVWLDQPKANGQFSVQDVHWSYRAIATDLQPILVHSVEIHIQASMNYVPRS